MRNVTAGQKESTLNTPIQRSTRTHLLASSLFVFTLALPLGIEANWLFGAKAGIMQVKFDDASTDSDPVNLGLMAGYEFNSVLENLAAELEVTRSVSSGSVVDDDLEVESMGIYASYRTRGQLYGKLRLGVMEASLTGELAEDEGGETYGVAVGWRFPAGAVELDYTSIDDDVSFISLGLVYWLSR